MFAFLLMMLQPDSAAAAIYCASLPKLVSQQQECEDNTLLSRAAESCLQGFKAKVKAEEPNLRKLLLKNTASAVTSEGGQAQQAEAEKLGSATYDSATKKLDQLIAEGEAARAEVEQFRRNLFWPFIWSAAMGGRRPDPDEPGMQRTLDGEYCYGEHSDIIKDALAGFDQALLDLKTSRQAAGEYGDTANSHRGNLNGGIVAAPTGGQRSPSPDKKATPLDGDHRRGLSGISGREDGKKPGK